MKIRRRQAALVAQVRKRGRVSVDELAALLGASRETIRRDLTELARQGRVDKVHGGATMPRVFGEGPFQQRMTENADAKMRIARAAAGLFAAGKTLFVDTGSTTVYFAEELARAPELTVVTNSVEVARILAGARNGHRVFLLGGEYAPGNSQTIGTMVAAQIRAFRAHHAVLAVGALDARSGAMDFDIEEAQVARAMIERAERVTVLADASKFDALASFEVCPLARIDRLVCDAPPPEALARGLVEAGAEIALAP